MWAGALVLAAAGLVALWTATATRVVYTTQPVVRAELMSTVNAIGQLQPNTYVDVGAQVSGQILRIKVEAGDSVKKGDLLVEIDPSVQRAAVDAGNAQLAALRAQREELEARYRLAVQQRARQAVLVAHGASAQQEMQIAESEWAATAARIRQVMAQIDQIQATLKADSARLGYTRIYAPMAGTVVAVEARAGQTLNAAYQTPSILRIADLSVMTVWTDVSEADVRQISPGMPVHFTTLGRGRDHAVRRWQGRVRQVLPGGSASSAQATKAVTYTALFDVDNADRELLPQMTAQVVFVTAQVDNAVVVPLSALAPDSGPQGPSVRVLAANGRPEVRSLRLGVRSRSEAQVLDGLQMGEALITGESRVGGTPRWLQW